jgi:large conductance mechanosensitive channel
MVDEFREFIMRGNVVDLAVAVMMGAAFGAIVTSLNADILTPFVGVLLGGVDFSTLSLTVGKAVIAYGKFIQAIINFLVIALALFFIIKAMNAATDFRAKKEAAAPPPAPEDVAPPPPPDDIRLLTEIRDLLKENVRAEAL